MKRLFLLPCCVVSSWLACANGSSVSATSVAGLSNPIPRKLVDVELVSEHLTITPMGYYTRVQVKYLLWNKSDRDYLKVDYAFPIDYYDDEKTKNDPHYFTYYKRGWLEEYATRISFFDNGQLIPHQRTQEPLVRKAHTIPLGEPSQEYAHIADGVHPWYVSGEDGGNRIPAVSRQWYFIRFDIPKRSFKTLEVQYDVVCAQRIGPGNPEYIEVDFVYDFSPAQTWGSGRVGDLFIEVDTTELNTDHFEQNLSVGRSQKSRNTYPFVKTDKGYSCHLRDFSFADKPPLVLELNSDNRELAMDVMPGFYGWEAFGRLLVPSADYTVRVSRASDRYPTSNASDRNLSTALVLPNNGTDQEIVVQFVRPTFVREVLLLGGYYKSQEVLTENSRLKAMATASSVDQFAEKHPVEGHRDFAMGYPSRQRSFWGQVLYLLFSCPIHSDQFDPQRQEWVKKPVTEIRLYPLDVFAGSKYTDLCITELFVVGKAENHY